MLSYDLLKNRAIIQLSGKDAESFLLRIITNVIPKDREAKYSMILSPQGRYLFDFFIINNNNVFFIDCLAKIKTSLLLRLNMYKLKSEVEVTDVSAFYDVLYTRSILTNSNIIKIFSQYRDPRFNKMGFRVLVEKLDINHTKYTPNLYLEDKYKFTIPDGEIDLLHNKSIPIEYGADKLNAISYTKGCYIGQELISRVKSQGVVRKKIYNINSNDDLSNIQSQTAVILDDNVIGSWCSSYKNQAIALVKESNYCHDQLITVQNIQAKLSVPEWR